MIMSGATRKLRAAATILAAYLAVFDSPADALRYARLRAIQRGGRPSTAAAELRLRMLGGASLHCRASRDVWTFKHTFLVGYHRPPIEIPEHGTIVDLGTNVGYTVADMAYRHPTARVLGVEMDDRNFEIARRNTACFGDRVQVVHAAVWIEDGVVTYAGDNDDAFAVTPVGEGAGARSAPALRLTTLFDRLGVEQVDYLKMDIEGAEAAILAAPLDWADRVRSMKVELHPPATMAAARAALEGAGFRCRADAQHPDCVVAVRA